MIRKQISCIAGLMRLRNSNCMRRWIESLFVNGSLLISDVSRRESKAFSNLYIDIRLNANGDQKELTPTHLHKIPRLLGVLSVCRAETTLLATYQGPKTTLS